MLQVYVIMGKFATGKAIPCCWALLPNKSEESYQLLIDAVQRKSSDEDETLCLTNNSLERYNRTLKKLVGSHPNVWLFIQSLIGQEADARRVLMHNAAGMDLSVNQGRDERHKDHNDRLMAVMKRVQDLSPYLYMQTLAKQLIDK